MKKRILVAEDDSSKWRAVQQVIASHAGARADVVRASTVSDAMKLVRETLYDLLIVDLIMPMRRGELPVKHAGLELLRSLSRGGSYLRLPKYVIALSADGDAVESQRAEFFQQGWVVAAYNAGDQSAWIDPLRSYLARVLADEENTGGCDAVIVTALRSVEFNALQSSGIRLEKTNFPGDPSVYYCGTLPRSKARLACVAATEMGMAVATALATRAIGRFRPRVVSMCGIAAGVKGNFGDVLVASRCWDYGEGKIVSPPDTGLSPTSNYLSELEFRPRPKQMHVSVKMKSRIDEFQESGTTLLAQLWQQWAGDKPAAPPRAICGTLATGAAVISNRAVIETLKQLDDNMVGLEMEAYAMFVAAANSVEPLPECVVMKSICDFGDGGKSDTFQRYAAYTSARYLLGFLDSYFEAEG